MNDSTPPVTMKSNGSEVVLGRHHQPGPGPSYDTAVWNLTVNPRMCRMPAVFRVMYRGTYAWAFASRRVLRNPLGRVPQCVAPSEQDQQTVRSYVSGQYPAFKIEHLFLTDTSQASPSCFWKMTFTSTTNGRHITVFLSPDHKYITPVLFDLSVNPRYERDLQTQAATFELVKQTGVFRGSPDATVTLVEFSDFQCPYCKSLSMLLDQQVLPQEKGVLRVLYRQFPLSMHSWAVSAAYLSKCVEMQDPSEFWPVHDFLFLNQSSLTPTTIHERLLDWASHERTLDISALTSCIDKKLSVKAVETEQQLGE